MTNDDFLRCVVNAVAESGSKITSFSAPGYLPIRLRIKTKTNIYSVQIYIWQLVRRTTHKSQFQIQITGTKSFSLTPREKTLILGWWREAGVFVGFDVKKHLGKLGSSYSLQVPENLLHEAYLNGFHPYYRNKEALIAFTPDFFTEYIKKLETLHDFGQLSQDPTALSQILRDLYFQKRAVLSILSRPCTLSLQVTKAALMKLETAWRCADFTTRLLTELL